MYTVHGTLILTGNGTFHINTQFQHFFQLWATCSNIDAVQARRFDEFLYVEEENENQLIIRLLLTSNEAYFLQRHYTDELTLVNY